ncbi:MAG: PfkB family carbohydrate kinase [Dehalococcoidia bacterium]
MDLDIIGIGSALVDITIEVDDKFLDAEGLPKGGMTLVEADRSKELQQKLKGMTREISPGGATANVMASFAHCGGRAGFIGKVGRDEMGAYFEQETEAVGVKFVKLVSESSPTGIGLTLITPDRQRTFATNLGAAVELSPADLSEELLNQAHILHLEAYLVFNRELMDFILSTARANGQRISMDLSSFDTVKENLEYLERIVKDHLDIVFANEDESLAFTGLATRESLGVLSRLCEIAVVKEGALGSHIANGAHRVFLPAEKAWVVDTNGAGDAYAGAVLYGLSQGMSVSTCGRIGTRAGGLIVGQRGARSTPDNARFLRDFAEELGMLMLRRLQSGSLTPELVVGVGEEIASFHEKAAVCEEPDKYGSPEWVGAAVAEVFSELEDYVGKTIEEEQYSALRSYMEGFLEDKDRLMESRVEQGRIISCHGELHTEHICLGDSVTILDCLEFDDRFSYSDPAYDLGLLTMELGFHGRSDLEEVLERSYVESSDDRQIIEMLPFYKIYHALVRGKYTSFRLEDEDISKEERETVIDTSRHYFELACSYLP